MSLPNIIGCEEFPRSEHGKLLVEDIERFINSNYKYDGREVVKAFDMAATHSLYLDGKRVDPSTFGKYLSRSSVGKILTAYKESKQNNNSRPLGYNRNQLPEAQKKVITPEEAHDLILKWIKTDGIMPEVAPYKTAYSYLVDKDLIKPVNETKRKGRSAQMFDSSMDINPKRQAAENWYLKNVI